MVSSPYKIQPALFHFRKSIVLVVLLSLWHCRQERKESPPLLYLLSFLTRRLCQTAGRIPASLRDCPALDLTRFTSGFDDSWNSHNTSDRFLHQYHCRCTVLIKPFFLFPVWKPRKAMTLPPSEAPPASLHTSWRCRSQQVNAICGLPCKIEMATCLRQMRFQLYIFTLHAAILSDRLEESCGVPYENTTNWFAQTFSRTGARVKKKKEEKSWVWGTVFHNLFSVA